eukprot:15913-Heterococcus_DN1.PRE.2
MQRTCSSTQVPLIAAAFIALIATGSWPSPREMTAGGGSFFLRASVSIDSVGSAPVVLQYTFNKHQVRSTQKLVSTVSIVSRAIARRALAHANTAAVHVSVHYIGHGLYDVGHALAG